MTLFVIRFQVQFNQFAPNLHIQELQIQDTKPFAREWPNSGPRGFEKAYELFIQDQGIC